jgi:hypothetical protein
MAQVVNIAVELDDSGAVQGVRNIEGALTKVGQKGNVVFTGMRNDQQRAHEATSLFVRTLNVEVPRALEKVIAKSSLLGPLMSAAFNAIVVVGFIAALVQLAPEIAHAAQAMGGYTQALRDADAAQVKLNNDQRAQFGDTGTGKKLIDQTHGVTRALETQEAKWIAAQVAAQSFGAVGEAVAAGMQYGVNAQTEKLAKNTEVLNNQIKQSGVVSQEELRVQQQVTQARNQAAAAGLKGQAAIAASTKARIDEINAMQRQSAFSKDVAQNMQIAQQMIAAAEQQGSRESGALARQNHAETIKLQNDAVLAVLEGKQRILAADEQYEAEQRRLVREGEIGKKDADDRIAAHHKVTQEQIRQEDKKTYDQTFAAIQAVIALGNRETAAMVDENTKRAQNHLESLHSIGSAEQEAQAAIAELNGNTVAAILIQEQQRETETIAHLRAIGASDEELARMRVAMQAQANVQIAKENRNMVNTLGSDLEGIFDDIFSGNIAKRLLDIAKKFFFQLLAQFLLSFGQVRQMFAGGQQNGGGIFGGLLSMIFGNGGGGIFGGAGGGTTAALGGAGGLFNVGLGAPGIVGSGGGIVNGGGFGGTLLSGGSGLGASVQGGVSTVGGANQSLLGRLFGGNTAAASSILGGGMMGLSAIIGGLQGGGVVNSAIQGGLGGAMTGFGVAMLAGGPIGAAVGGAIFLASLLAGIFGGGGSRAQAMARGQFLPQISKTKDDYMAHVLEFQAALQQLAQIGANAQQQLGQFGKPGLKAFGTTVQPAIDDATRAILMTERERKARRDIPLNEGQFHVGGLIGPNGMPGGPERANEVRIRALAGEYVVNPQATARNLGLLEQINNGGSPSGGGGDTYNFSFLDVGGLREWLDAGGSEELSQGMDRFRLRYSGGSA